MQQTKFNVAGMTCSACSAHVEKAAAAVPGVKKATVSLLANTLAVSGEGYSTAAIEAAVQKAGYTAAAQGETAATAENPMKKNMADMRVRLIVSFAFLAPLMYVSMGHMLGLPLPAFLLGTENAVSYALIQLLLCLPVVYVNRQYFINGFKTLVHGAPTMDSLIAIGSTASIVYGIFAIMRIGYGLGIQDIELVHRYHMDLYFESAATILALITLGKFLETRSKGKTGEAIEKLMNLAPKTAVILLDGKEKEVPVEQVQAGNIVLVRPGQSIPVDGVILHGKTTVDEAALTGESLPVEKSEGQALMAASINQTGFVQMRAEKVGQDTTLAQIIRLVEDANTTKAPIAKLADKIAGVFVPVVISIAVLAVAVWLLSGARPEFAISIGIAVLVISCPCALGLATPVAIMVGTGKGAENGILIKSGEALERAHSVQTVVLDKTGTVTEGKPVVTDVLPQKGTTQQDLLRLALALETPSEHPLAKAVVQYAEMQGHAAEAVQNFSAIFGRGVQATLAEKDYFAGNTAMLTEHNIAITAAQQAQLASLADDGKTPLLFADKAELLGIIAVADTEKPSSAAAIEKLQSMGIDVVMLTGDNQRTATAIQRRMGIKTVIAEVLPQQKEQQIAALQKQGKVVAMVGDGINDAPALARADVGIAIGAGTDVALESADIVLMKSDLLDVVTAIRLSKAVLRNIKENLFWAFFYNSVGIPLAAGVFYPVLGWKLNPMFAAAAMSLSSVCVVLNALRLKRFRAADKKQINQKEKEVAVMKNYTMKIEGMMCAHCQGHVSQALNALPGVQASVDLAAKTAAVTASQDVTADMLRKAVTKAGYTVTEVQE